MMTAFQEQLEHFFFQSPAKESLKAMRIKAWDRFLTLGLPTTEWEEWRTIKLRKLFEKTFDFTSLLDSPEKKILPHILPECEEACLVFINGQYREDLSRIQGLDEGIQAIYLEEAERVYGSFFNHHLAKSIKEERDPFAVLNGALGRGGLFLYFPPKFTGNKPIQILHLVDASSPCMAFPRLHVLAGAHAECKLILTPFVLSEGHWINQCVEILAEEGAQVHIHQMHAQLSSSSWHFDAIRAHLKRNSLLKTVAFSRGSETSRTDYKVHLAGENCEADLSGLWLLEKKREAHVNILIDHQAPNCRSNQLFKGVLQDVSRSSFEGKIYVRREAQKTEAFQLNNNLLLSEGTMADSKPNLEIFADDVKASHGATVGQLDQEQLFYLKTRGFSLPEAEEILVKGYCQEILDRLSYSSLKRLWKSLDVLLPC